jgi:hypothetical protein
MQNMSLSKNLIKLNSPALLKNGMLFSTSTKANESFKVSRKEFNSSDWLESIFGPGPEIFCSQNFIPKNLV